MRLSCRHPVRGGFLQPFSEHEIQYHATVAGHRLDPNPVLEGTTSRQREGGPGWRIVDRSGPYMMVVTVHSLLRAHAPPAPQTDADAWAGAYVAVRARNGMALSLSSCLRVECSSERESRALSSYTAIQRGPFTSQQTPHCPSAPAASPSPRYSHSTNSYSPPPHPS